VYIAPESATAPKVRFETAPTDVFEIVNSTTDKLHDADDADEQKDV
jgi:hypothetical protein